MRRTQIYLTDEQARRLSEIATDLDVSRAEVIRRILDRDLGLSDPDGPDRAVIVRTSGLLSDYPDWPDWLESVRGAGADRRLRSLGL